MLALETPLVGHLKVHAFTVARAKRIILPALAGIGKDIVGFLDFLESGLGGGIVAVEVGVVTSGKLAIGRFDGIGIVAAFDAQYLVIILELYRHYKKADLMKSGLYTPKRQTAL